MRVETSAHLHTLLERISAATTRLAAVPEAARISHRVAVRRRAAEASVRLDASPLEHGTATEVDRRLAEGTTATDAIPPPPPGAAPAGWAGALKLEGMGSQEIAAVEYAACLAAHEAVGELAAGFSADPLGVLSAAHGHLTGGLVDPAVRGRLRRTDQAVHDGAQGLVIYHAPDPATLPGHLGDLMRWLESALGDEPAPVVASVVHGRLLALHPYEAANGRLARLALRIVMTAADLPAGDGAWEPIHERDALGYHREVAATARRRGDLTRWVETDLESVASGFEAATRDLGVGPSHDSLADRASELAGRLGAGEAVTVAEHAAEAGCTADTARKDFIALAATGLFRVDPRTRGLRAVRSDMPLRT